MESRTIMQQIIESTIILGILGLFVWGLVWASEKEDELGIRGMSSERILAREEMKNK